MLPIKHSFFPSQGIWLKGNLHSHTTRTDGTCPPQKQIDDYHAQGYDFLAITDHNVIDSHKLPCPPSFCLLPGWERDIPYAPTKCLHLVGLTPKDAQQQPVVEEKRCVPGEITDQQLLDQMKAADQFVVLAHPIWSRMEPDEVLSLQGFDAIEVFNMGCERLCHAGHAEVYWDMLLRTGRRVYAVACDDTHQKTKKSDRFGGWIMLCAPQLAHQDILQALRQGNFYSSMGPVIYDWGINDGHLYIQCSPCKEVHFVTYPPRGMANYSDETGLLTHVTHQLRGGEVYLRAECIDQEGNVAWTNAVFMEDLSL